MSSSGSRPCSSQASSLMRWAISTLRCARLGHPDLVDGQRDDRGAVLDGEGDDGVELVAPGLEVDRVDDRAPRDLLEGHADDVGLGRVDLDGGGLGEGDALDDLAHLLVLVLALGERDADVEHVGAALDLVLGDLHEAVVVVGQQQLLGLARALRVDALAHEGGAWVLHERGGGDHRADVRRARRRARPDRVARAALDDGGDVLGRRAAAAADDGHAEALDELAQHLGQRLGLLGEDRLAVGALQRQAGVGDAVHRHRAVLAEEADRVAHVLGAGRAVESERVDLQRLQGGQHGADVGAQQHLAAVGQQRDARLDRDRAPERLERLAGAEDRGLDLEDVLGGLDDDEVGAALDEPARLLLEDGDELAEGDLAQRRVVGGGQVAGGADRPGDELVLADRLARDLGGALVDLERVLAQAPLLELQTRGLEAVGLHDLGARLDHRLVQRLDDVRAVQDQRLVALALQPAVVGRRQVVLLERRAHRAVEDDDALARGGQVVAHPAMLPEP